MEHAPWHTGIPSAQWDTEQAKLSAHFLQSRAWAAFQVARGNTILYAATERWSWVAVLEKSRFGSRLYAPYGPTAATSESLKTAIKSLLACGKEHNVDFIRIEPRAKNEKRALKAFRARRAHRNIQPKHTFIKELDRSEEELLKEMSSSNRRLYLQAEKNGFRFTQSQDPADMQLFLTMIHEVAARTGMQPHPDEYFTTMAGVLFAEKSAELFVALHRNKPVATAITFETATTRYYAHAASAEHARKMQPGVPLLGHLIMDAKAQGKLQFDFYGVSPPGARQHKWYGLSRFKRSFGGNEVEYAGTWEIPLKKARYQAYRLLLRLPVK